MIGNCNTIPLYYPPCWIHSPLDCHVEIMENVVDLCDGACTFEDVNEWLYNNSDVRAYNLREICKTTGQLPDGR